MSTVDCSRYQGVLSVPLLLQWKAAAITRVILKAGGGDSGRYQDSKWAVNSANVRAAGLILEAYWFNGTTDPVGDAKFLLGYLPAGVRVWADVENEGSMPHWSDDQADAFERTVIAAGHPAGTYMSASVTFGSWPKCSRRPLWVAGYGFTSVPRVGNWVAPVLWQYTSTGHLPGYGGNLDLDQDLAGLDTADVNATTIPAIPLEADMKIIRETDNGSMAIVGEAYFGEFGGKDKDGIDAAVTVFGPVIAVSAGEYATAKARALGRRSALIADIAAAVKAPAGQ